MQLKALFQKYKDMIPYAVFGVLTTLVNIGVYWVVSHPLKGSVMLSTVVAWVVSVLFAYVTNRKWVFHSAATGAGEVLKELTAFFGCRIATGVVDWLCMYIFVDLLSINDVLIKTAANILVIILNYVASKWVIFKTGKTGDKNA